MRIQWVNWMPIQWQNNRYPSSFVRLTALTIIIQSIMAKHCKYFWQIFNRLFLLSHSKFCAKLSNYSYCVIFQFLVKSKSRGKRIVTIMSCISHEYSIQFQRRGYSLKNSDLIRIFYWKNISTNLYLVKAWLSLCLSLHT